MVKQSDINQFNSTLKESIDEVVAVVVGGTNGIGRSFLQQLATLVKHPTIYYVGRSQQTLDTIMSELASINPNGTYIPIQSGDLTLLASVESASAKIKQQTSKIDILYLSPGYLTFSARDETSEGLDAITSIRYYARFRFVFNLIPLLDASTSPRVVTVLAGGLEGQIFPDDLSLKDPKNYSIGNAANTSATYTTLSLEYLQKSNTKISFVHMFPGLTRTNLFNTPHFGAPFKLFMNWIIMPTVGRVLGYSAEDVGARALYAAMHPSFASSDSAAAAVAAAAGELAFGSNGKEGSGVYTLNDKTDSVHNDKVLGPYREEHMDKKIWEHTLQEYKRILD